MSSLLQVLTLLALRVDQSWLRQLKESLNNFAKSCIVVHDVVFHASDNLIQNVVFKMTDESQGGLIRIRGYCRIICLQVGRGRREGRCSYGAEYSSLPNRPAGSQVLGILRKVDNESN